jgi:hypothetical protein
VIHEAVMTEQETIESKSALLADLRRGNPDGIPVTPKNIFAAGVLVKNDQAESSATVGATYAFAPCDRALGPRFAEGTAEEGLCRPKRPCPFLKVLSLYGTFRGIPTAA